MKVKTEISICTGLMLNDHSNPYIESTTVLSDTHPKQNSESTLNYIEWDSNQHTPEL